MPDARPRLILIDGHAVAYRQYFVPHNAHFSTQAGEPTGATFGFARTLLDILRSDPPPDYLAVVFDQGLSGRDTAYAEYKSTRAKMEDPLIVQMGRIREVVEAFNIPILEKEGYEADDVIGAVAKQAPALGVNVYIITGDQDLFQLVNDYVTVELPSNKGEPIAYDANGVQAKLGVKPAQIPDYKAIVGDSSDNIPGVKGVGEKTVVPLLEKYGTLDGIYANLHEIKEKTRKLLEAGRESAYLSRKLATIQTDIPITIDLAACRAHDYDVDKVLALFEALEFRSLIRQVRGLSRSTPPPPPLTTTPEPSQLALFDASTETPPAESEAEGIPAENLIETVIVDTPEALESMLAELRGARVLAFDTETTGLDTASAALVGISLSADGRVGYYLPVGHTDGPNLPRDVALDALRPLLTDPNVVKVAHNAAYDLGILRQVGLEVSPLPEDTMLMEFLIRPTGQKGLKDCVRRRFGVRMAKYEELTGKAKGTQVTMDKVPVARAAPYAAADAAFTCRLLEVARADLVETGGMALYEQIERPLIPVIVDLNQAGAMLDVPYLRQLSDEFAERLNMLAERVFDAVGERFSLGSPKQLNEILFNKLKLPTKGLRKSTHGFSVDADALEILSEFHPAVRLILEWRGLEKLKNTYVDALPRQVDSAGRVHTTYHQTGAVTGRLSSENPNLQNIPIRTEEGRRVRKAFIAPPGSHLLSADYSQIELRILAHYSGDEGLIRAFREGRDIHRATAALVRGVPYEAVSKEQRYFAKRVNFGLLYGMGAARLARESELSKAEAEAFIRNYFERLPGVRRYLDESKVRAREVGYLETLLGRRRDFSILKDPAIRQMDRARIEREAVNMPIQGSAADIIKVAMIRLSARLKAEGYAARMILQVHDELVLEVPDHELPRATALLCEVMEGAYELAAPLKVEANIGQNWAELTPAEEWLSRHA